MKEEFKLQFYFNLYKDYPVSSREKFKKYFEKNHGVFRYFNELTVMIDKYQHNKYGETLHSDVEYFNLKLQRRGIGK